MSDVFQVTDENFDSEIINSDIPAMVDFWAAWCGPCRMVGPVVEELAKEYEGKVKVGKLDIDQNRETATKYQVMSVPTVIVFQKGKEVKRLVGFPGKAGYQELIDEVLKK